MKPRPAWKNGAILLQTLVMSIILSMIAIMIMKWVLMRYVVVGHMHRSITSNTRGEGYNFSRFCNSNWNSAPAAAGIPNSSIYLDGSTKKFTLSVVSGTAFGTQSQKIEVTTDIDW